MRARAPRGSRSAGSVVVLALSGALLAPLGLAAQSVDVELAVGGAVGNYTATDAGLDVVPGPSFGVRADLWLTETLAGYLGFTRSSFGCEEALCTGGDVTLTTQGLVVGGHWSRGLPWVRAGLTLQGLGIEATGGIGDDADPGLGVEVAGGVELAVGERVRVRPGLRYLRHQADAETEGHVALLAFEVGVAATVFEF